MYFWTQDDVDNAIKIIGKKASTDADFRKLILNNPNKAIKETTGKEVPEGFVIKVIENESGIDQTYVLPDIQGEELSDADLDAVAGGGSKKCNNQCGVRCAADCPGAKYK